MMWLSPAWLWLLLLTPLPFVWPQRVSAAQARRAFGRALTLALIVLALAQPARLGTSDRPAFVVLVDASPSVAVDATELKARADALATTLGQDATVTVHSLDQSLLGAGLARAGAQIPRGQRAAVVLLTDGQSRDAEWPAALQALAARDVPVHAIELPTAGVPRITKLTARSETGPRVGAPYTLLANVDNQGTAREIVLEFVPQAEAAGSAPIDVARTTVPADTRGQVRFDVEPDAAMQGLGRWVVRLVDPEGTTTNQTAHLEQDAWIAGPRRVLYLTSRDADARTEMNALIGPGFDLVTPAQLDQPLDAMDRAALGAFDLVVLDDEPAAELGDVFLGALSEAVRQDGLGLFATGGERAFGPGGWHNTSIENLLPVELVQKEEKRDPSTTLVVILDTSGSMGGQRVQLAKEVARLAIHRLLPHDKVGIVEFYGAKRWAAPIQPASNSIELERALNRLSAGGGTVILPAIEEAYYGLKNVRTRYKHVLILTDGGVETGAFEPLLRSMSEEGINVSTVLIGGNAHSEFLVTLSNWGKGRFYSVPNRFNLPEIILKQPTTAKLPALRPGPHALVARGGPYWWGAFLPPESSPLVIDAYVETRLRPGAAALLESRDENHPVLATWALGQGRVTALMTELTGPASAAWRDAAFVGPLLARVLEQTRRAEAPLETHIQTQGAAAAIATTRSASAQFAESVAAPRATSTARVLVPSERATWLADVQALAPAAYTGEFNVPAERAFDFSALAAIGGSRTPYDQWDPAWRPTPGAGAGTARLIALWPWLLIAAILAYLVDVLVRRLSFPTRP